MAYELPSEPLYKITQQLRQQAKDALNPPTTTTTPEPTTTMMVDTMDDHHDSHEALSHSQSKMDLNLDKLSYINSNAIKYSPKISFNSPVYEYKNPTYGNNRNKQNNFWNSVPDTISSKYDYYKNNVMESNSTPYGSSYDYYDTPYNKENSKVPAYKWDQQNILNSLKSYVFIFFLIN